jgi:hypothetical protein
MKRLLLLAVSLASVVATAQAQVPAHYGEIYEKETGKPRGKEWFSSDGSARMEYPSENGTTSIAIVRRDSMAAYILRPANKTYIRLDIGAIIDGLGAGKLLGIEAFETESSDVERVFRGTEVIDGVECNHYFVQRVDVLKGGSTSSANWDEWINPADNIWRQHSDDIRPGSYLVKRNIRIGAQPSNLFAIPRDYQAINIPVGGMLEMFMGGGTDKDESDQMKNLQNQLEKLNQIGNDPTKTQEQKLQDAMKMFQQLQ